MLGIDAQSESIVAVARVNEKANLFEGTTNGSARARRVLDEDRAVRNALGRRVGFGQRALKRVGDLAHDVVKARTKVRANVQDQSR